MKGRKMLSGVLMIIVALIIMQLPVSEADAAKSASDFKMEGSTLVKYRGTDTNVSVPDTVEIIGQGAFEDNDTIELVVVPNSVKRIEAYAFWGCDNLDTVVLGKGLTEIGDFTFTNCKGLKEMSIPDTVSSIGSQAFADCVNLQNIKIPPEVTEIQEDAFDGCAKLVIHYEAGSVAEKYAESFYERQKEMAEYEDVPDYPDIPDNTNNTDVPNNTGNQDDQTPDGNAGDNENSVVLPTPTPDSNAITEDTLLGTTKIVGNRAVVFIDNTSPTVLDGSNPQIIGSDGENAENAIYETEDGKLAKYTIVDGRIVADQAYYRNRTLERVVLPQGIEEIGQFSFSRSLITEIVLPEGVKEIGYGAFYHCDNLGEVLLPSTVENIEPKAFEHTFWLENFLQNGSGDFLISGNVLVAYRGNGDTVTVPEGVTVIAGEAFGSNRNLRSDILPESLLTIGEGAFEGCSNLTELQTGSNLRQIKDRAFAGCPLGEILLPASVSEVGLKAFDENVLVEYEGGQTPTVTHERSAERLSNEKYRNVSAEDAEAGVTVTGVEPAMAQLEGAGRSYLLSVETGADKAPMQNAYRRSYRTEMPETMTVYDLQLTDNSGIPITKFGKQTLTVTVPVPEDLVQENILIYMLDRNGQLEKADAERVLLDGMDAVRFQTTHLSLIGICGDGNLYQGADVMEVSTVIQSMSAGPGNAVNSSAQVGYLSVLKGVLGSILLLWGMWSLLQKGKR